MLFTRILVPLDGSETAEKVLTTIRPLLDDDTTLVPLCAVWVESAATVSGALEAAETQARAYLDGICEQLASDGVKTEPVVKFGPPADVVLEVAHEMRATLVAMTTHGRTGLSRWLVGSVAEKVLRISDVPLLLLRSYVPRDETTFEPQPVEIAPLSPKRILIPIDGSPHALDVVAQACRFAKAFHAEVDVLRVVAPPYTPDVVDAAAGELTRARDAVIDQGITVADSMRQGEPAAVILEFAEQNPDIGLIAMRTHGRDGASRWLLGSVTENVLRHATLPLLVIRSPVQDHKDEWRGAAAPQTDAAGDA